MPEEVPEDDRAAWWVVCLCAAWCGVCREWRPVFDTLAQRRPAGWRVAWVDVEDDDDAMGDVDIETFPSVLVAHGGVARFLGPVAPSVAGLERLVAGLEAAPDAARPVSAEAQALFERLRGAVLPRSVIR